MSAPAFEIRAPQAFELAALAAYIVDANSRPSQRSLHCPAGSPGAVRAALRDPQQFPDGWEGSFVVAVDQVHGEITAVCGCQGLAGETTGFLWGPWVAASKEGWRSTAPSLLSELLARLPSPVSRVDAFLDMENRDGLRFLTAHGFTPGPLTHVYVALGSAWQPPEENGPSFCAPLRPAHEIAFANLHAETFPAHGSTPARELLDGRDDEHAIFAATDGLRFLGSVCVSVNRAPLEGFVDYLAVKPSVRGRGIGQWLLQTALHWAFATRRLPQMALTVSDWRADARRLYERSGFALHASGIAARKRLR